MLYYDEYGNKENPTILLLHGAAAEIYEPEKTVEELLTLTSTARNVNGKF